MSTVKLFTAFEINASAPLSASFFESGSFVGSFAISGSHLFLSHAPEIEGIAYESLGGRLSASLNALGARNYVVNFNVATNRMHIAQIDTTKCEFVIDWHDNGTNAFIGASGEQTATNTFEFFSQMFWEISAGTSPYFFWESSYDGRSSWEQEYEPEPFYVDTEADDGSSYTIGSSGSVVYSDWEFQLEPQSKIRASHAAADVPWTWEHLIKHIRSSEPFFVVTDVSTSPFIPTDDIEHFYRMRSEATVFRPQKVFPDYEDYLTVFVRARIVDDL